MQLFRASLAMQRCSAHRSGSGTAGVAPAQPYCSGTVRAAAAHLVLQWHSNDSARGLPHSPCCNGTACVTAAQPMLRCYSPCCSGTVRITTAQSVLHQHSPCCSITARFPATHPFTTSTCTSCVAAALTVLQRQSPCCSSTVRVAAVDRMLQWYIL